MSALGAKTRSLIALLGCLLVWADAFADAASDDATDNLLKWAATYRTQASEYSTYSLNGFAATKKSDVEGWLESVLADCEVESTLRFREFCGRFSRVAADALSLAAQERAQVSGLESRRVAQTTTARIIDAVEGHESGLSPYKPNYAVIRPNPLEMKFQFSFKYKLFTEAPQLLATNTGLWNRLKKDVLTNAYFSYTQESFWDLDTDSAPFRDINFNPQLFLYYPRVRTESPLKGYWIGIEHESNGRDGAASRSWDRFFAKAEFSYGSLVITPKVWSIIGEADDNPDIEDFAGYFELQTRYEFANGSRIHIDGRRGNSKGGVEIGYSFKLPFLVESESRFYRFDPWIHMRYWTGYGENLLTYNEKSSSFRLGFSFALPPVYPSRF